MEARKIQLIGNRSYSVSLPKQWVLANNLNAQDTVFIEESGGHLIIQPTEAKKKDLSQINVELSSLADVAEFIVFCYVKNINKINIHYKIQMPEKVASIRKVLSYLDGYDITSEDEKHIEISFLFHDINIKLPQIMNRIIYILKLSTSSLDLQDRAAMEETEMNIDRLYNLSKRIIFSCINSAGVRKEHSIINEEDLFFFKDIFKRLEQIGDSIFRLSSCKLAKDDISVVNEMILLLESMLIKKAPAHELKLKLMKVKISTKNPETALVLSKIKERCMDVFENAVSIEFNRKYFS